MSDATAQSIKLLSDPDPRKRRAALRALAANRSGEHAEGARAVNLHSHTCYSFNGYGYSPSMFAWKAAEAGLYAAGIVDFDVLDGVDEFLDACTALGLRGCAGMETRVYVEELSDVEINSPGEPGIAYHMGSGFVRSAVKDTTFLDSLKKAAQDRTRDIAARVNSFLHPVTVDFDHDVLPRTPAGNATERHLCEAYAAAAEAVFPDPEARAQYWSEKLGASAEEIRRLFGEPPLLHGLIRSRTMKRGGPGYVQSDSAAFPRLDAVNAFVRAERAIPTCAWLDGCSAGEADAGKLLDLHLAKGTLAVNVIPDRNWNIADPKERASKGAKLANFLAAAQARSMPVLVGTEMNAYGQRFVDDFDAPELRPHDELFAEGAAVLYGHTRLETRAGMGYVSAWAELHLPKPSERNVFFGEVGRRLPPQVHISAEADMTPGQVLACLPAQRC